MTPQASFDFTFENVDLPKREKEIQQAIETSTDVEKIWNDNMSPEGIVLSSGHAVNEQLLFIFDSLAQEVSILIYLRPFKSFLKRLCFGFGYIINWWSPFGGNWECFTFERVEAERLIAFLKKVQ